MPKIFEEAIHENEAEKVHNFLIGGRPIPVDIPNKASQTGLMIACDKGSIDVVEEFLENENEKPNLDSVDALGWTALHHASDNGNLSVVELLNEKNRQKFNFFKN
jgi:ankyrin repeat protein